MLGEKIKNRTNVLGVGVSALDMDEAVETLELLLDKFPKDKHVKRDLALLLAHRAEQSAKALDEMTEQGGIKLHPDTARAIGDAQGAQGRAGKIALWVAAIALVVLAVGSFS